MPALNRQQQQETLLKLFSVGPQGVRFSASGFVTISNATILAFLKDDARLPIYRSLSDDEKEYVKSICRMNIPATGANHKLVADLDKEEAGIDMAALRQAVLFNQSARRAHQITLNKTVETVCSTKKPTSPKCQCTIS